MNGLAATVLVFVVLSAVVGLTRPNFFTLAWQSFVFVAAMVVIVQVPDLVRLGTKFRNEHSEYQFRQRAIVTNLALIPLHGLVAIGVAHMARQLGADW